MPRRPNAGPSDPAEPGDIDPADFPTVCPGSTGPIVEAMQRLAGLEPTGWYTGEQVELVRLAQALHGLEPNGDFTAELAVKLAAG